MTCNYCGFEAPDDQDSGYSETVCPPCADAHAQYEEAMEDQQDDD
jgi:predicted RNA-binding Zn-ribbon protein involved in translation (DUF1610 family)